MPGSLSSTQHHYAAGYSREAMIRDAKRSMQQSGELQVIHGHRRGETCRGDKTNCRMYTAVRDFGAS